MRGHSALKCFRAHMLRACALVLVMASEGMAFVVLKSNHQHDTGLGFSSMRHFFAMRNSMATVKSWRMTGMAAGGPKSLMWFRGRFRGRNHSTVLRGMLGGGGGDDGGVAEKHSNETGNLKQSALGAVGAAILLIAGTTVGGGFLALPYVVAPAGFAPSAATLVGVWLFFMAQSMVVVEILCNLAKSSGRKGVGMTAAAGSVFGRVGEVCITALIVVLTKATIVSQISKGASILAPYTAVFVPLGYSVSCALITCTIALVVFGGGLRLATNLNSVLTALFAISAVFLFLVGAPHAQWARLAASNNWAVASGAIPTMLQLLVYGEILPSVCALLHYNLRLIRIAIVLGSSLPLIVEVAWAALGLALVQGGPLLVDPVDVLLSASPVRPQLLVLAVSAITTTVIGSFLALQSVFDDIAASLSKPRTTSTTEPSLLRSSPPDNPDNPGPQPQPQSLPPTANPTTTTWTLSRSRPESTARRVLAAAIISLPSMCIAASSPSLFLAAIDFAGSYPVVLLWGVAPPLIALSLRRNVARQPQHGGGPESQTGDGTGKREGGEGKGKPSIEYEASAGPSAWVGTLGAASCLLLVANAVRDVLALLR
jgi:tyrosine-specific transport protein